MTAAAQPCSYPSYSIARTSPPCGAVVVDITGKHSNATTIQSGVDALSTTITGIQSLFIYPGVYFEQIYTPPRAANLTISGYINDTSSYHSNTVNITYNLALINATSDDLTATVHAWTTHLKVYNLNILNTFGYITASGRNSSDNPSWYAITNSSVAGINATVDAEAGLSFLGRPWAVFARVVFQYTYLSEVIPPAGWSVWNAPPQERISNVTFAEFENYGPGSFPTEGPRANFSEQLIPPIEMAAVLGAGYESEWWVDMSYPS